jgi:hypothetical protein
MGSYSRQTDNAPSIEAICAQLFISETPVEELGNLGLTEDEEDAIVAFMKTLSDGYKIPKK